MTRRVIVQPMIPSGSYPNYYTIDSGVKVGPAGELMLVAQEANDGTPLEFRIYAPGTWKEINVDQVND